MSAAGCARRETLRGLSSFLCLKSGLLGDSLLPDLAENGNEYPAHTNSFLIISPSALGLIHMWFVFQSIQGDNVTKYFPTLQEEL